MKMTKKRIEEKAKDWLDKCVYLNRIDNKEIELKIANSINAFEKGKKNGIEEYKQALAKELDKFCFSVTNKVEDDNIRIILKERLGLLTPKKLALSEEK